MAIPTYEKCMLPLLKFIKDGSEYSSRESVEAISDTFFLSHEERNTLLPSGSQKLISNRVNWAKTYLKKAGLVEAPRRGFVQITSKGLQLIDEGVTELNTAFLKRYDAFNEFYAKSNQVDKETTLSANTESNKTPDEQIAAIYTGINNSLADELLHMLMEGTPDFFETVVVHLIVGMGYGGSLVEAGKATQKSNDGGIDGVIKEDRLGLETIYLQAKRWNNPVSRPDIQKFAGALQGQHSRKGIFITTSRFSQGAIDYCKNIESKIILIDGDALTQYMIEYNVGVSTKRVIEIKEVDTEFFSEA